jgi:hypothetical protein
MRRNHIEGVKFVADNSRMRDYLLFAWEAPEGHLVVKQEFRLVETKSHVVLHLNDVPQNGAHGPPPPSIPIPNPIAINSSPKP